ncbi:MAG: hypothetical protein RL447_946, partial [Bacteroidota bacterium]
EGDLVGAFVTEYIHASEGRLEFIPINSERVGVLGRYHHFIVREPRIDQSAAHLGAAVFNKQVIVVVADGDLIVRIGDCRFQEAKWLSRNDEGVRLWAFHVGSLVSN